MAFISYDSYKNRIEKLAKFKNFVDKYKFLIIGVLAVIIAGASALMATKGMITSNITLSADTYTYGAPYAPTAASAFLSDVGYEYAVQGTDEWTSEKPVKVGKYSVRAVTKKLIGNGYGAPVNFEILPKKVEFAFGNETSLRYGDKPKNYTIDGLILNDRIDVNGAAFTYAYHDEADNVSDWTVDVTVEAGSVKIIDNAGNDSSNCYIYDTAEKTFALTKRGISVRLQDSNETYCGAEIGYKGELFTPDLAEGDSIAFETEITQNGSPATLLDAGEYGISVKDGSIKITKGGADVTKRYDYGTPVNGTFTVRQRPLTITTQDGNKVYDGKALSNEGATPDNLVVGHKLSLPIGGAPSITDVGTIRNAQTFDILDSNGVEVSHNYDYQNNYKYGYLTVTPCPLTITTGGDEWEYDGTAHPVKTHNANGLAEGQVLANISYSSEYAINVLDSGKNELNFNIVWGESGAKVDINNYAITENYGDIKITARPLKVETDGDSRPYNGTALSVGTYTVTYAGEKTGQTNAFINYGEDLSVVGSLPKIINVGTKENAINFTVPNNNYYIKETVNGILQITQAEITVTLDNASCDYGDTLPAPNITISGSGIVNGELFGGDTFTPTFKYLENGATPASYEAGKTYDISLDTANSAFTYGNSESVTQPNYKITSNTSTLTVTSRGITVYLNDTTVIYGNSLIYNVGNETVYGVVEGQTVQVDAKQVEFKIDSTMPDAGTYVGKISCESTAITVYSGTTPVTSNYSVKVEVSTLTVSPRPITVHAKDMLGIIYGEEIDYTAVHNGSYKNITGDGLANGETLTINSVSYFTANGIPVVPSDNPAVGTYKIKPSSVAIKKSNGDDSRSNYQITPADDGVFTIVERPITIKSATDLELIYDGTAQFNKVNEVTSELDILIDHRINVKNDYATVTDVSEGTVQNVLHYEILDSFNNDVTKNYAITDDFGKLKVNPRPITVKLLDYSAEYATSYLYQKGVGNYKEALLLDADTGEVISGDALIPGEQLEVLDVIYEFDTAQFPDYRQTAYWVKSDTFKVTKADGTDSTKNYQIPTAEGALTINKRAITVTLNTYTAIYGEIDGENGYTYATGVGNYANTPDLASGEKLEVLDITYEFGSTQFPNVREEAYWVKSDKFKVTKADGTDGTENYQIPTAEGWVTIIARPITVTLNSFIDPVIYGNEVVYNAGDEATTGVLDDHTLTVTATADKMEYSPAVTFPYLDVGNYTFTCDDSFIRITDASDGDVKANYSIDVKAGSLEIETRKIKVKPTSYFVQYGENFNYSTNAKPNYDSITEGSLATFDGEEETLYISVTSLEFDGLVKKNVGPYTFKPDIYTVTKVDGTDSTKNYEVEFEEGTLTITTRKIEVELKNLVKDYGDDEYYDKSYSKLYAESIEVGALPFDEQLQFTVGFTQNGEPALPKNLGLYNVVITKEEIVYSDGSIAENGNYSITYIGDKLLQIISRQIKIIPDFVSVIYGEEIAYPSGSSNFTYGTVGNNPLAYNMPKYDEEIEITVKYALDGKNPPSVGKYAVIVDTVTVHYKDGTPETLSCTYDHGLFLGYVGGYSITFTQSDFAEKLEITPRPITVQLYSNEVYYGDKYGYVELNGNEYEDITDGTLAKADDVPQVLIIDGVEYEFGLIDYPNARDKAYSFIEDGVSCTITDGTTGEEINPDNYAITFTGGELTIKKRPITVTIHKTEKLYGEVNSVGDLPLPDFDVTGENGKDGLINGDQLANVSFNWERKDGKEITRYDAGEYTVSIDIEDEENYSFTDKDGNPLDVRNYVINECTAGTLTVTKRKITLDLKDIEREYGEVDSGDSSLLHWDGTFKTTALNYIRIAFEDFIDVGGDGLAKDEKISQFNWDVHDLTTPFKLVTAKNVGDYVLYWNLIAFAYSDGTSHPDSEHGYCNYEITGSTPAKLTINPKALTVTLGGYNVRYGGELVYAGGETAEGQLSGHKVSVNSGVEFTFTPTDPDGGYSYPDVGIYEFICTKDDITVKDGDGNIVTSNYNITVKAGGLYIYARDLKVVLNSIKAVYGETVKDNGVTVTGQLLDGHEVVVDGEKAMKDYQNLDAKYYDLICSSDAITVIDAAGNDVTRNYSIIPISKINGLNITARKITVTLQSVENIAYGDGLPVPEVLIESAEGLEKGLAYDDKFIPAFSWLKAGGSDFSHYDVGEYVIILDERASYIDVDGNKLSVNTNYQIMVGANTVEFEITQREITVTLHEFERVYGQNSGYVLRWCKDGDSIGLSVLDDMNIDDLITVDGLVEEEGVDILYLLVYKSGESVSCNNVGDYEVVLNRVVFHYADKTSQAVSNYKFASPDKVPFSITERDLEVKLDDITATYGDDPFEGYSFETTKGLFFEETLAISKFFAEKNGVKIEQQYLVKDEYSINANASDAVISVGGEEIVGGYKNYNITFSGRLTVIPRTVEFELFDIKSVYEYGEEIDAYQAGADNYTPVEGKCTLVNGETLEIAVGFFADAAATVPADPVNAGTYYYAFIKEGSSITGGNADIDNYLISCTAKPIVINPKQLSITLNEYTKDYDGEDFAYPKDFEVFNLVDIDKLPYGETITLIINFIGNGSITRNPIAAGEYTAICFGIDGVTPDENPDANKGNYNIVGNHESTLTINKRIITVTVENAEFGYELDEVILQVTPENLPDCVTGFEVLSYEYKSDKAAEEDEWITGIPTEVGTYSVRVKEIALSENYIPVDHTKNYIVKPVAGTVKIMELNLYLVTQDAELVYDGTEQFATGFKLYRDAEHTDEVEVDVIEGVDYFVTYKTTVKNVNDISEEGTPNIVEYNFEGTNFRVPAANYSYGTLTMSKRTITVVTGDVSWVYDGDEHHDETYEILNKIDNEEVKHTYLVSFTTLKDKEETANAVSITDIRDEDNQSVYDNYDIQSEYGTASVTARHITVRTGGGSEKTYSKVYDGTPLVEESYETYYSGANDDGKGGLLNGDTLIVDDYEKMICVGENQENKVTFTPASENYVIDGYEQCLLTITPLAITIVIGSATVPYGNTNSNPIGAGDFTYAEGSAKIVEGEVLSIAVKYYDKTDAVKTLLGSVKDVVENGYGVVLDEEECSVQTTYDDSINGFTNYEVHFVEGTVTVNPKAVTVALEDLTKVYGEALDGYPTDKAITDVLEYGEELYVDVTFNVDDVNALSVGEYAIAISSCTIGDETYGNPVNGEIKCKNYIITFEDGTLTVTARPIYVVTGSAEQDYNGTALYSPENKEDYVVNVYYKNAFGVVVDGIVDGDEVNKVLELDKASVKSIIKAGWIYNEVEYILLDNKNYELIVNDFVYGILTVKQVDLTIELKGIEGDFVYGNTVSYNTGEGNYNPVEDKSALVNGEKLEIAVKFYTEDGTPVGGNPVNAGKYYYELDLDNSVVTGSDTADVNNYNITCYGENGGRKEVFIGKLDITVSLVDYWSGEDIFYSGESFVYDATKCSPDKKLPYEESLIISVIYKDGGDNVVTQPKDAGTYKIYFDKILSVIAGDNDGATPTPENYSVATGTSPLTLEIKKRTVTVTVENAEFGYWIDEVVMQYTVDNLPDGASVEVSSYQYTVADTEDWTDGLPFDAGTYYVDVKVFTLSENGAEVDPSINYIVVTVPGTVQIKELELYLVTKDGDFEYDGTEQKELGFKLYRDAAHKEEVEFNGSVEPTSVTTITNVSESGKENIVYFDFEGTNYKVPNKNYSFGTLTMTPRAINVETVSSADSLKGAEYWTYDGTAKFDEYFTVTSGSLVKDHGIKVIGHTEITYVTEDEVANELKYEIRTDNGAGEDVSGNYEIIAENGTLKVTPRPITIELIGLGDNGNFKYGDTVSYNGGYANEPDLVEGETLTVAVKFYTKDDELLDGAPKNAGIYYYVFDKENTVVTGSGAGVGIENYKVTCNDKIYITISKLKVTVTLDEWGSEEYTGYAYEYPCTYTQTGSFAEGETLDLKVNYYTQVNGLKGDKVNELIDAGKYLVVYDGENSTIGGVAPEVNYEINILPEDGISFTITPKNITINMGDESRIYNGEEYDYLNPGTAENFVVQAVGSNKIIVDNIIPATASYEKLIYENGELVSSEPVNGKPVNAGTYKVTVQDFDVQGGKKSNYNLLTDDSKLYCNIVIERRDITFTVKDLTIESGEPIEPKLQIGGYGLVAKDVLTPTFYLVGDTLTEITEDTKLPKGTYVIRVDFPDGEDVLANYNPTYNDGTLIVTARQVTVTTKYTGEELVYDGNAITLEGFGFDHVHTTKPSEKGFFDYSIPTPVYTFKDIYGNTVAAPVNAGKYTVTAEFTLTEAEENLYTIVEVKSCTITISPRSVTVTLTNFDESQLTKYLTYSFDELPKSLLAASVTNIVDVESSTVECYYYNKSGYGEVEYNYAGDYEVKARIVKDGKDDGNYKVESITEATFTVKKAPLYVTPIGENADFKKEGQTLSLKRFQIWEEYGKLQSNNGVKDTLTIKGSGDLSAAAKKKVTIQSVKIMQNGLEVTNCYDVHYTYEAGSPVAESNFYAWLSFNPIVVEYRQPVPKNTVFVYDGTNHSSELGVNLSEATIIDTTQIVHAGYSIDRRLTSIVLAGEYDSWVTFIVKDSQGRNVSSLYEFRAVNANSKVTVIGDALELQINLNNAQLEAAWEAVQKGESSDILTGSANYNGNVYYLLDASYYTPSGLKDGVWNEDGEKHACEVLVRKEGESLVLKVIVFEEGSRAERSLSYNLTVTTALTYSVTITRMGLLNQPDTTI